jgi:hypothetical protein
MEGKKALLSKRVIFRAIIGHFTACVSGNYPIITPKLLFCGRPAPKKADPACNKPSKTRRRWEAKVKREGD